MEKFEIHEKAGEMMFQCLYPSENVNHQYEEFKLDFLNTEKKYVGDIKFRTKATNAYDDTKGIMIEPTKLKHFIEAKEKYHVLYGVLIYFNADGVSTMRMENITDNPHLYEEYIQSSNVEKQQGSDERQNEIAYHIPSTHEVWNNKPYTTEQKKCYDKILKWKETELKKLELKVKSNAIEMLKSI